jgi:polysaccharide biosynthesis/export protein
MLNKLLSHLPIFLLIIFIVGCSELNSQFTRKGSTGDYQNFAEASEADIPNETYRKERTKQRHEVSRRERYLIDINDVLNIMVFKEPELSMTIRVSDEGILSYPLIGDIEVKSLTTQEVEKILETRLKNGYLKAPKVTVRLDIELMGQYGEKEVFVLGEVKNPGAIQILGKYLTVLESITKAGGFAEFAAPNRTKVIRVQDGIEKTIKVDLNKVKKGDKSLDIILKPGDVIVVPETYM